MWATAFAASEGFSLLLPAVVFLLAAIAGAGGLGYAVRRARFIPAFVVWAAISALVTAAWVLLTGVAVSSTVGVVMIVVVIGIAAGLQLLYRRRALAAA